MAEVKKPEIKEIKVSDEVAQRMGDFQTQIDTIVRSRNSFLTGVAVTMGVSVEKYEFNFEMKAFVQKEKK